MEVRAGCCIVGGGPAGMMAGLLFARAGVPTVLLEKHADFLRDFRGDTIHPSTLDVMAELGLLEAFLKRPHQEVTTLAGNLGDQLVIVADFTHLPTRCKFVAFMPQWHFLNFLAEEAKRYGTFDLRMQASAKELLWEDGRVAGVRAQTPDGIWISAPTSRLPPTDANRWYVGQPLWRSSNSALQWTCSGCGLPNEPTIHMKPSVTFETGGSWR